MSVEQTVLHKVLSLVLTINPVRLGRYYDCHGTGEEMETQTARALNQFHWSPGL